MDNRNIAGHVKFTVSVIGKMVVGSVICYVHKSLSARGMGYSHIRESHSHDIVAFDILLGKECVENIGYKIQLTLIHDTFFYNEKEDAYFNFNFLEIFFLYEENKKDRFL